MGKIGKALKAFGWIVRKPVLLNRVLSDEDTWQGYVEKNHEFPDDLPVIPEEYNTLELTRNRL